jgi:hydrogenase maturation protease
MTSVPKIGIVGIGNVLMGDDALGPYVIKRIDCAFRFSSEVALIEAGTPGLDLTSLFYGFNTLIVVDTVRVQGKPGEVRRFNQEGLLRKAPNLTISPHDPGLKEALLTLQIAEGGLREIVLIGVIAENVELGLELSESVQRAVPLVIEAVLAELKRFGIKAEKKCPPDEPDIWWNK